MNGSYTLDDSMYVYIAMAVMSLFVFGFLLLRMFVRMPKGLILSCFISYLYFLKGGCRIASGCIINDDFWGDMVRNLVAFGINTLCFFAIIRLILYIKHKVSAKKPQVKQAE